MVNELRERIETAYNDMQQVCDLQFLPGIIILSYFFQEPYRLHAVIVHEGEASAGHYWAYIADYATLNDDGIPLAWRKYNDKSVCFEFNPGNIINVCAIR